MGKTDMPSGTRNGAFDALRAAAAFLIVGSHIQVRTVGSIPAVTLFTSHFSLALFCGAAGWFLAISLERHSTAETVRRRVRRILPPMLAWSAAYVAALSLFDLATGSPPGYLQGVLHPSLAALFRILFRGGAEIHMWFLPCLLYSSILAAIADRLLPGALRSGAAYLAASAVAVAAAVVLPFHFAKYDVFLWCFLLQGAGLFRIRDNPRARRAAMAAAICFAVAGAAIGNPKLLAFGLVPPAILACARSKMRTTGVLSFLASVGFTVYLAHPLVARFAAVAVCRFHPTPAGWTLTLAVWIAVYAACVALAAASRRIAGRRRGA